MRVILSDINNKIKVCPVGFSWTILLFGCIVPLFRLDLKNFVKLLIFSILTLGISNIYFAFTHNNEAIRMLLIEGFIPTKRLYVEQLVKYKLVQKRIIG